MSEYLMLFDFKEWVIRKNPDGTIDIAIKFDGAKRDIPDEEHFEAVRRVWKTGH